MTHFYENIETGTLVEIVDARRLETVYQNYYRKAKESWSKMHRDEFLQKFLPTEQPPIRYLDSSWNTVRS